MSQKFTYNGIELEVEMSDADFLDRYEKAFNALDAEEKSLQKTGPSGDVIRGYCRMFYNLFDSIYGKGTGEKLFNGKMNVSKCYEAYALFIDAAKRDAREASLLRSQFVSKYAPNREQKRHSGKNKPYIYKK